MDVDEASALSGGEDETMRLWDVSSGDCTRTFKRGDFVDDVWFRRGEDKILSLGGAYGNDNWQLVVLGLGDWSIAKRPGGL